MKLHRWIIGVFVLVFGLGIITRSHALTALYNTTIRIVDSAGTVLDNGIASATSANYNSTVRVVNSSGLVMDSLGANSTIYPNTAPNAGQVPVGNAGNTAYAPQTISGSGATVTLSSAGVLSLSGITPAAGGVGAMTGAPMWARNFGDGVDSTGPASGAWGSGVYEKHFTSWTCTGAITVTALTSVIVRSQGTVALNSGCSITTKGANTGFIQGDLGGAGGSGGAGGAGNSAATGSSSGVSNPWNQAGNTTRGISAQAAVSSGGAGNDGGAIAATSKEMMEEIGYPLRALGGGLGSQGGTTGGAAGPGGGIIVIIAPTITVASGVILDASGSPGVASASNGTGAGGGGGGGVIWLISESFTDSGGIYRYGGGPGGAITAPSIQADGGGCDTTGCGTDAYFTVTGLTTGGLDAAKITIANAGTGYKVAPVCKVNAGASGLIGSPACHFTLSGGTIASVVIDTPGSGGALTTFTTAFVGGYGANGWYWQSTIQ